MSIKVLIVDDSSFLRHQIRQIVNAHPKLTVIGEANNGKEAISKTQKLKPDVITMDYEMPLMDGITAVREIMHQTPTPILMFSSMTLSGARITLDALEAGAVDFLPKQLESVASSKSKIRTILCEKIIAVSGKDKPLPKNASAPKRSKIETKTIRKPELLAIGTSTGGPVALQKIISNLPAGFSMPIVIIQHMPAAFTGAFAERLDKLSKITVKEAQDNDVLKPGHVYIAPGGKQMMLSGRDKLKILAGDDRVNYKPCVDVTFGSIANQFNGRVLAIVLTGMGADGREGARMLKAKGHNVWAQDSKSCVIDGMPSAVINADLVDEVVSLNDFSGKLAKL